jgi:threonine synthase
MMIVVVALHLIQVFPYGADKKPREATWMVGVGLLLLTLGYGSSEAASPFPIVSRACASVFRLLSGPYNKGFMPAELACIEERCRARFPITDIIYNCPKCGGLLDAVYPDPPPAADLRALWLGRRTSNAPLDQSGVWRFREFLPFLPNYDSVVTLREGNTPLLDAPQAARYGGLDRLTFKHQGFNPTGSFKDNGMTCGIAQALRLGKRRVACVSTGNTSASMAAYASAAGLQPIIFIPHGNIAYGKLAQALEYGARTLQVEANFDQILALVRRLAERLDIYLLNSMNPFRIEGQKTIMVEMMEQRYWRPPDWVVLPGGNLGNTSAFGKALREMKAAGLIGRLPRLAVVQAEGSAPFYDLWRAADRSRLNPVVHPQTLATAIKIGDPVSWPKALREVEASHGVVEKVTEQEIADAKAIVGRCGIGCEPASAATLAGIRKLTAAGSIPADADVVAVLTGNVLKDPDYIYRYHTGDLRSPSGARIEPIYGNRPIMVSNDEAQITAILDSQLGNTPKQG